MESENLNLGKISLWAKAVDSNVSKPGHRYMEVYNGSKALQRKNSANYREVMYFASDMKYCSAIEEK